MSQHLLPTDLVNKILAYLASKCYSEVAALIAEIQAKAVSSPISVDAAPCEAKPE